MLYILERRPDGLGARRCQERAQVPLRVLGLAGHVEEGGAVQVRLGYGSCSLSEEQPHLREEPPHVEVVGLLHHELGELQRAGADLGGHAHAGLAAVRLERLHEGQEPLRVVYLFVTELLPTARSGPRRRSCS